MGLTYLRLARTSENIKIMYLHMRLDVNGEKELKNLQMLTLFCFVSG